MAVFSKQPNGGFKFPNELLDAFGRQRVSSPDTIFDSKQIFDNAPNFWDDQEVSGGGTSSIHSMFRASTTISVSAATAGRRIRQTYQSFNYQPGKSTLVLMTWVNMGTGAGVTKLVGMGDDSNGLFYMSRGGVFSMVQRSSVTGAPVEEVIPQGNWNLDTLDGNGPSKLSLDLSKALIAFFDFEWLGVGLVRMGFVIDGEIVYAHKFLHSNIVDAVYISTPNLPLRYEIENDGTGVASSLEHICSTVISEGGFRPLGIYRWVSTGMTEIQATTAGTNYAVCGIRLRSSFTGATGILDKISIINTTNDDFQWYVCFNPTIEGSLTWVDIENSACQYAIGDASNPSLSVVSDLGIVLDGGYIRANTSGGLTNRVVDVLRLGKAIDGTPDELFLVAQPRTNGANILGGIRFQEFV